MKVLFRIDGWEKIQEVPDKMVETGRINYSISGLGLSKADTIPFVHDGDFKDNMPIFVGA